MSGKLSSDLLQLYGQHWPEIGDRLFIPGHDVWFAQTAEERTYRLGKGYKLAGDRLVQNAFGHPADYEDLVYPIIFCYRHSIEVVLKAIIEEHDSVVGVTLREADHDLPNLWKLFLHIAKAVGCHRGDEIAAVGACIKEMAAVDPGAISFRYARTKRGDLVFISRDGIDLQNLQARIDGIYFFLECADQAFSDERDTRSLSYRAV
jgi:hypothetical protein